MAEPTRLQDHTTHQSFKTCPDPPRQPGMRTDDLGDEPEHDRRAAPAAEETGGMVPLEPDECAGRCVIWNRMDDDRGMVPVERGGKRPGGDVDARGGDPLAAQAFDGRGAEAGVATVCIAEPENEE